MLNINYNLTDLSFKLEEFSAPVVPITLLSTEFIYVGFYKPLSSFYIELGSTVESLSKLSVKYDGIAGLTDVSELIDRTLGLGNSGRVSWVQKADHVPTTRFGKELYWYVLSVDVDTEERNFVGINVLFSDDKDIDEEYPGILENLPDEAVSFVNFHASARKDIVQSLRKKFNINSKNLTQFDLLDIDEVRQASKYLALSKICNWLSQLPDDKWSLKAGPYYRKHADYLSDVSFTVDTNDNGKIDDVEKNNINFIQVIRI